jgi:hypothetical protein
MKEENSGEMAGTDPRDRELSESLVTDKKMAVSISLA